MGSNKAKVGDTVSINYIGSLEDGTVFDTNIESVATENNLQKQTYEPLSFKIGSKQVIPGFENAVIGMVPKETKKFKVDPKDGYPYNEALIARAIPKDSEIEKFIDISPVSYKKIYNKNPVIGDIASNEQIPFSIKVLNVSQDVTSVEVLLKIGDKIKLTGTEWISEVIESSATKYKVHQNPEVGANYIIPQSTGLIPGKVINVNENSFDVDTNPPLAGKTLTFEVTLLEIKP